MYSLRLKKHQTDLLEKVLELEIRYYEILLTEEPDNLEHKHTLNILQSIDSELWKAIVIKDYVL